MKTKFKYFTPAQLKAPIEIICDEFLISFDELIDESNADIKEAKAIISYFFYGLNQFSPSTLGRFLNQSHSTVISQSKRIKRDIEDDSDYDYKIKRIIKLIK